MSVRHRSIGGIFNHRCVPVWPDSRGGGICRCAAGAFCRPSEALRLPSARERTGYFLRSLKMARLSSPILHLALAVAAFNKRSPTTVRSVQGRPWQNPPSITPSWKSHLNTTGFTHSTEVGRRDQLGWSDCEFVGRCHRHTGTTYSRAFSYEYPDRSTTLQPGWHMRT